MAVLDLVPKLTISDPNQVILTLLCRTFLHWQPNGIIGNTRPIKPTDLWVQNIPVWYVFFLWSAECKWERGLAPVREKGRNPNHHTQLIQTSVLKKKQSWGVQLCLSSTDFRTCFDSMLSWCVYHTPWQLRLCPNLSSLLHIKRHLHGTIHSLHLLSNLKAEFLRSWMKIITEIKYNLFQITEKQQTSILSPI